jgi:hypothetical protein
MSVRSKEVLCINVVIVVQRHADVGIVINQNKGEQHAKPKKRV